MTSPEEMVNVRYVVDDVQAATDCYTAHLGFTLRFSAAPAFADARFRKEIVTGPGGRQILVEDPAGNMVELSEPATGSRAGS